MAVMMLIAKILMMTIQVNLVPNPSETWRRQHSPELPMLNFLLSTYHYSHFLAATLNFTSFFHKGLLGGRTLFLQLGCFWIRYTATVWCLLSGAYNKGPSVQ